MLLDRTHQKWAVVSTVILAVSAASYVMYAQVSPRGPTGGSMMGLLYGVVGTAMMVFAGMLAGKRQVPFWRIGSAQFWLRGHLWLGTLSFPMIMFHAGFGLGGLLEQILWLFFLTVVLSGFFGLAMQHFLPKLMASRIPRETFAVQVPYVRKRNRILSDRVVFEHCGQISLRNDPLQSQIEGLAKKSASLRDREAVGDKSEKDKAKVERGNWLDWVPEDDQEFYRDLARQSKTNGWTRTEDDFTSMLLEVYDVKGIEPAPVPAAEKPKEADAGDKPDVPVPQLIRLHGAFGTGGAERVEAYLEAVRKGEAPAPSAAAPAPATSDAKPAADAKPADTGPKIAKVLVEDISSEMQSIRSLLTEKYGFDSGLAAEAANNTRPFLVQDPDREVDAIRDFFVEKYGFDKGLATNAAEKARPFLGELDEEMAAALRDGKAQKEAAEIKALLKEKYNFTDHLAGEAADQARVFIAGGDIKAGMRQRKADVEVNGITALLTQKYGYTEALAKTSAEKARPYIDGSAWAKEEEPAAAAAAPPAAGGGGGSSPLDMMRQQAAGGDAPAAGSGGSAELSTVEIIRLQGPPGSGGEERIEAAKAAAAAAGPAAAAAPAAPPPPKKKVRPAGPVVRTGQLRDFYADTVRPYLTGDGRKGRLSGVTESTRAFSQMRSTLPVELHTTLESLETRCEEHRQFAEQERIHHWLHYWLALHIPVSIALFVLVAIHIVVALRVVPWKVQ